MDYETFLAKVEKVEHEPVVKRRGVQLADIGECYSRDGVIWASTPQGYEYWLARRRGNADMSEEDYEFVRSLIV